MATPPRHTNRLARQKSPYLLQHAHNPVDWFAWQEEAFEKSRREDKPIFLSIGYSTCHWCHVMERESFEDEKIATFLNQHFVSIKVDREERPDVDRIYMMFVQATTGQGGWPLNVFLTPELKPFFGGTYFPPEDRQGRRGFPQFLRQIHELWKGRRDDLANSAAEVQKRLAEAAATQQAASSLLLDPAMLRNAGLFFKQAYDPRHGGFGGAPKFPHPSQPQFLLRYGARFRDPEALEMVLQTCDRMAAGGIHDQLGGGFARYSVDAEWQVPHFEKMLYDNAQLLQLYLDACLVSQELPRPVSAKSPQGPDLSAKQHNALLPPAAQTHAEVARSIMAYVLRDMTHPDGGFYSAEDADSEGHEGKFYCWTPDEVEQLLTPAEFQTAVRYFGITERGNFVDHSHPSPLPNQNVLRVADPTLSDAEKPLVASARKKLLAARSRRVRPHLDDKILASWNGLMLGACARAYAVLGDEAYRAAAEKSLNFIQEKLWVPPRAQGSATGNLFHRWRDGERDEVQLLEGYAFLLGGVIDLYEAALEPKHLDFAIALAEALLTKFHDSQNGGFWETVSDAQHLILRIKQDYDGAEPSGNSVAALALLKLGAITNRKDFAEAGRKSVLWLAPRLRDLPQAVPCLLQALDFLLQEPKRVVIAGDPHSTEARKLLRAVHSVYQPNKVVLGNSGAVDEFTRSLPANGEALVYLCTGTSCRPPTSEASKVREMLRGL